MVVALRLSCGVGFQVTVRPAEVAVGLDVVLAMDTQPVTVSLKRIWYQVAVAASLPRML